MVTTTRENYYSEEDEFTANSGFAFAIVLWNDLDPSIGELEVVSDEWGFDETTGEDFWRVTPLETHICSDEELGLSEDSNVRPLFMPSNKKFTGNLDSYRGKIICIDREELRLRGEYNSDEARIL